MIMLYNNMVLWIIHFSTGVLQPKVNSIHKKEKVLGANCYIMCETEARTESQVAATGIKPKT